MDEINIYNSFLEQYQDYPKELFSLVEKIRPQLPKSNEDENYNFGTNEKDKDIGLSSNIAVINAHTFEKSFDDYKKQNPLMSDIEAKARVVFDFLSQHGISFTYENNKDDVLFQDNGKDVIRENFYANAIYKNALSNTNFFDRHISNMQILCLEPKSVTDMPRNIDGLSKESFNNFMNIPDDKRMDILYKRGLYHELIHMTLPTTDERKCDAFALLKTMQEYPEYAKTIFDVYNIQRSKMGYTIDTLHQEEGFAKQRAIKGGAMTYLMPNTYKKLEQYALNPKMIPQNDEQILHLTCLLTCEPEFSKEQLSAYAQLLSQKYISPQDLANNEIVQTCMAQGGFDSIDKYIASDEKLQKTLSTLDKEKLISEKLASVKNRISEKQHKKTDELISISSATKVPYNPKTVTINPATLKLAQNKKQKY